MGLSSMVGEKISFLRRIGYLGRHKRQSSTDQTNIQNEILEAHNKYRGQHCVPKMKLDAEMNADTQKYAEYLASINKMVHDPNTPYGENIYAVGGGSSRISSVSGEREKIIYIDQCFV